MLTCRVGGVALKSNVCVSWSLWLGGVWVVGASQTKKWREASLSVEGLKTGRKDRVAGYFAIPAIHVRLNGVNACAAASITASVVIVAVISVIATVVPLLQRLAQQTLVVPVVVPIILVLVLKLRTGGPCPWVPLPVVSWRLDGALPAGAPRRRGAWAGGMARSLEVRRIVFGILLLGQDGSGDK